MSWAVLQTRLEPVNAAQLARAFEAIPSRTAADARQSIEHMRGFIARGLPQGEAARLAAALEGQGLGAAAVDEAELIALPPPRKVRRLGFEPEGFVTFDSLDRATTHRWSDVLVIAAGQFAKHESSRERSFVRHGNSRASYVTVEADTTITRVEALALELLFGDGDTRLHLDARDMFFDCLGQQASNDRLANFAAVIDTFIHLSPHALVTEPAQHIAAHAKALFTYPTLAAFEREIIWLVWRGLRP